MITSSSFKTTSEQVRVEPKELTFRSITTLDDLRLIESAWRDLEAADPHCPITGSFDWLVTWWETFASAQTEALGHEKELLILCAFSGEQLAAAAPFLKVKRRSGGVRITCIEFLGQQWGAVYQDILKRPELRGGIDLFLPVLRKVARYDVMFLKHIPAGSDRFPSAKLVPYSACPELSLKDYANFDEFYDSCSKKLRGNLRQGLSRIHRENMTLEPRMQQVDSSTIEIMKTISESKLRDNNKQWLWGDSLKEKFYRSLFSRYESFATILNINDQPAVYFANIIFKSSAYCLDAAYDRSYPRFELGNMSVHQSIKWAFELGLKRLCMGPGLDEYKLRQANHLEHLCAYVDRGNTPLSFLISRLVTRAANKRAAKFQHSLQTATIISRPSKAHPELCDAL